MIQITDQYVLALIAQSECNNECNTDSSSEESEELADCERHGPDHIMEALKQVSSESGIPVEQFCYACDGSAGKMAELNRRAYALAAQAAGVRVLPEFQVRGVPCLVYGSKKKKISHPSAVTLRIVYESLRTLEEATLQDVARHSGLALSVVKSRIRRLYGASLVKDVSQRDSGTSIVWTLTSLAFDDVFDVQVPSIGPVAEATSERQEAA